MAGGVFGRKEARAGVVEAARRVARAVDRANVKRGAGQRVGLIDLFAAFVNLVDSVAVLERTEERYGCE